MKNGTYVLPAPQPHAVPAGTVVEDTAPDLAWLNAGRFRWGLPGDLRNVANWSQACAAHDAYMKINNVLQHPEDSNAPGYSLGGNSGGADAVLGGTGWSADANPWEGAPIHLVELLMRK